ncbi:hypothetical protein GCM10009740_32840 [Terrabacter terrae]|uniref:Uncharacterized protein n=1 Tax=Terrabacter terrae TaxID=318434 RepID=A0ABN2UJ82_9MICO
MVRAGQDPEGLVVSDVDSEFLALVCADQELLDAEFEEIVAGLGPPPVTPSAAGNPHGDRAAGEAPPRGSGRRESPTPGVRPQATGRERSPPRRRRPPWRHAVH